MVALTFSSPSTWKVFRPPPESAISASIEDTIPTPTASMQLPLVSQLVCKGEEDQAPSPCLKVREDGNWPSPPSKLNAAATTAAAGLPRPDPPSRSFTATSKVKTFGKQSIAKQHRKTTSIDLVPSQNWPTSPTTKSRMPKWWPRGHKNSDVALHKSNTRTVPDPHVEKAQRPLLLGRIESAPPLSSAFLGVVASTVREVTIEPRDVHAEDRKVFPCGLLEQAARRVVLERSAAKAATAGGRNVAVQDANIGRANTTNVSESKAGIPFTRLQQDLSPNHVGDKPGYFSTGSLPQSISRKAVPKVTTDEEDDLSHLPQELSLESEMLYPGISSSTYLSKDVATQPNILVSLSSDDLQPYAGGSHNILPSSNRESVTTVLKEKTMDLAREIEGWKKNRGAVSKRSRRVTLQAEYEAETARRKSSDSAGCDPGRQSKQVQIKHNSISSSSLRPPRPGPEDYKGPRSSSTISSPSPPPTAPLPSLPLSPKGKPSALLPPRNLAEAATQTSELGFVILRKDQLNAAALPSLTIAPFTIEQAQTKALLACDAVASAGISGECSFFPYIHAERDSTRTFVSGKESSLDFGSLGPPTDSSSPRKEDKHVFSEAIGGLGLVGEGRLVSTQLPIDDGEEWSTPFALRSASLPTSLPPMPSEDEAALEEQFWSLLTKLQDRETSGFTEGLLVDITEGDSITFDGDRIAIGLSSTTSTATVSFAGVRQWRDNVAYEADRFRKTKVEPDRQVLTSSKAGVQFSSQVLRVVSPPSVLSTADRATNTFAVITAPTPLCTLATKGSESTMAPLRKDGKVDLTPGLASREASLSLSSHTQVQTRMYTSNTSSVLSLGTRSRRTLSETEARRLFGTFAEHQTSLEPEAIVESADRGRTRSRNTFGVESPNAFPRHANQTSPVVEKSSSVRPADEENSFAYVGEHVKMTTAEPRKTMLASTNPSTKTSKGIDGQSSASAYDASNVPSSREQKKEQHPLTFISTSSTAMPNSTSICRLSISTPTPTLTLTPTSKDPKFCVNDFAVDKAHDRDHDGEKGSISEINLQQSLELVADRIGLASAELERLKMDLKVIARVRRRDHKEMLHQHQQGSTGVGIEA